VSERAFDRDQTVDTGCAVLESGVDCVLFAFQPGSTRPGMDD
jgi:hypothetical protein